MDNQALENTLKDRLAKLGSIPVEMSDVEQRVAAEIQKQSAPTRRTPPVGYRFPRVWRPAVGIAASITLLVILGAMLFQTRSAEASLMMQLHRDIVSGKVATMKVDSLIEVNEAFKAFGHNGIQMNAPDLHVMSCCMQNVNSKQVYCVLLNESGLPVTLVIADLAATQSAKGATVTYKGESFHQTLSGDLTMVTVDRQKFRICLIGAVPPERLMELSKGLTF
jgi:hypothetical protein